MLFYLELLLLLFSFGSLFSKKKKCCFVLQNNLTTFDMVCLPTKFIVGGPLRKEMYI
jgi:hypothetical protein